MSPSGDVREVRSACPVCGLVSTRQVYDIGSGPELACSSCEWCWGADGQDLKPLQLMTLAQIRRRRDAQQH